MRCKTSSICSFPKDDARCRLGVLQRELDEVSLERDCARSRLVQLQNSLQELQEGGCRLCTAIASQKEKGAGLDCVFMSVAVKHGLDERLTTTQLLLQQQEEAVRRGDRERRGLSDRVKDLERALHAVEMDKKHTQVNTHTHTHTHSSL